MTPGDWCVFVGGVNWQKWAKEIVEGGNDPTFLFDWPLDRLYAVFFAEEESKGGGSWPITSEAELIERRNAKRKKLNVERAANGEPLLPMIEPQKG